MQNDRTVASRLVTAFALALALALAPGLGEAASAADGASALLTWLDLEGRPVRFSSHEELKEFFQTARVAENRGLAVGVTGSRKLVLEKDGVRLHAHFQAIDSVRDRARTATGKVELASRDSYKYNLAAYELARLLGMDNIPPSFPRLIDRRLGSITAWVERAFSEEDRQASGRRPPQPQRWAHEIIRMKVFDQLIANTDRNQGNILIDESWKVWLIDHTRAFRPSSELDDPESIESCDRELWSALKSVPDESVRAAVEPWLTRREIKALLARRRQLVARVEGLVRERGAAVLYELEAAD